MHEASSNWFYILSFSNSFVDHLKEAKHKREVDINKICTSHYAHFLNSMEEMLKMHGSALNIKQSVLELHNALSHCADDIGDVLKVRFKSE